MKNTCLCQESLFSVSVEIILSGMRIIQDPNINMSNIYSNRNDLLQAVGVQESCRRGEQSR